MPTAGRASPLSPPSPQVAPVRTSGADFETVIAPTPITSPTEARADPPGVRRLDLEAGIVPRSDPADRSARKPTAGTGFLPIAGLVAAVGIALILVYLLLVSR